MKLIDKLTKEATDNFVAEATKGLKLLHYDWSNGVADCVLYDMAFQDGFNKALALASDLSDKHEMQCGESFYGLEKLILKIGEEEVE